MRRWDPPRREGCSGKVLWKLLGKLPAMLVVLVLGREPMSGSTDLLRLVGDSRKDSISATGLEICAPCTAERPAAPALGSRTGCASSGRLCLDPSACEV